MLSRFEVTRIVGLRALELAGGAQPHVHVETPQMQCDFIYVAATELLEGRLDARIERGGCEFDVRQMRLPPTLAVLLDTKDGGHRSYTATTSSGASRCKGNASSHRSE